MLAEARTRIRPYASEEVGADPDVLIVDIRSSDERERTDAEGNSSSLAAASLVEPGVEADELIGGYEAW